MTRSLRISVVVALALASAWVGPITTAGAIAAEPPRVSPAELYNLAEKATVELLVDGRLEGSGWFASADGFIVTAGHAIHGEAGHRIEVISSVAGRQIAKIIALDRGHDIALLKIDAGKEPYPFLTPAPKMPPPGEVVYLFAAANFRHKLMLRGSVARRDPTYEYFSTQKQYTQVYHVSAPAPPGTSGGCWLDLHGRVVGNQSGFMTVNGSGAGIASLATPEAIAHLIATQKSTTTITTQCAFEELWTQSVPYIRNYPPGSAGLVPVLIQDKGVAEKAGLSGKMIITAVDDHPVQYVDTFMNYIRTKKPGDHVTLSILRIDGKTHATIDLPLTALDN